MFPRILQSHSGPLVKVLAKALGWQRTSPVKTSEEVKRQDNMQLVYPRLSVEKGDAEPVEPAATIDEQVFAERLKLIERNVRLGVSFGFAGIPFLGYAMFGSAWPASYFAWAAGALAVLSSTFALSWRFRVGGSSTQAMNAWARLVIAHAAAVGLAWGIAAGLFYESRPERVAILLVLIIAQMVSVVVGSTGYLPAVLGFNLCLTLPYLWCALRSGTAFSLLAATVVITMAGLLFGYAITTSSFVKNSIRMRFLAVRLGFEVERLLEVSTHERELADTARLHAERARAAADLANRGKTVFLAAAGHDLRQPMHALVQYQSHLLVRNTDPALRETILRVGKSLDAMQDLLDSMLEVSKLLTGSVRPTIGPVGVAGLIDQLDAQLRPVAEQKGLEFVAAGDEVYIQTDEVLLERILRNLTINAVRYTREGRVLIRCKRRGAYLRIQVWDTGIGIAKDAQGKIFQEFYQVENSARDHRKGLGLGLALVRQLTDLLELRLRMRSTPGVGSVFMVDVPISSASMSAPQEGEGGSEEDFVRGAFVVLIDDNEESLDSTAETLRTFGARVLTASSGMEAIDALLRQEFMPQLVISDYRLEHGETGLGAIQAVIGNQKALFGDEFEISAMVISGDTAPQELLAVEASGYPMLHKPLRPQALYDAINIQLSALATAGVR